MSKRKRYSPEYKQELVEFGLPIEVELPEDRPRGWRHPGAADPVGAGQGLSWRWNAKG